MSVSGFSKVVFNISQQLTSDNVEALKYMYKVHTENISNLGVLTTLESKGVFSSSNVGGLRTLLRDIHRCDLLDLVRVVEDKRLQHCYDRSVCIGDQLELIREELVDSISSCKEEECFSSEALHCFGRIVDRLARVHKEMGELLITPLKEVCEELYTTFPGEESAGTLLIL